jgi:hypothetical protein
MLLEIIGRPVSPSRNKKSINDVNNICNTNSNYTCKLKFSEINSVVEHMDQYRNNWRHVQRMDRRSIPRQIMTYRPEGKRSLGRPLKLWREAVTGN